MCSVERNVEDDVRIAFLLCNRENNLRLVRGPNHRSVILRVLSPRQGDGELWLCRVEIGC